MPPKPKLPRTALRIPKGHTRADFDPEAVAEMDRRRWRVRKERQRKRAQHRGLTTYTFDLPKPMLAELRQLAKSAGMTLAAYVRHALQSHLGER